MRLRGVGREVLSWRGVAQLAVLVAILAVIPFLPALDFGFIADDGVYLGIGNRFLLNLPWHELWRLATQPANPWEFLPVRDLTYWVDISLFGPFGDGFHASNLIWYVATCGAVFIATRETLRVSMPSWLERHTALSCFAAAVFALHPSHVEAVVWISGRKDLLAGLFAFLAWAQLMRAADSRFSPRSLAWAAVWCVLALFSKSVAVYAVALIALVAFVLGRRLSGPNLGGRKAIAFGILVALAGAMTALLHSEVARATGIRIANDPGGVAVIERASRIVAAHLSLAFYPVDLRLIHDVYDLGSWHWGATTLAVVALVWALWQLYQGSNLLLVYALLWIVVPLLPYLQLMPFSTWSMASERFVFQSTFGWSLLLVWFIGRFSARSVVAAMVLLGVLFMPASWSRVMDWSAESRLWAREAERNPGYFNAVRQYVQELSAAGDHGGAAVAIGRIQRQDAREIMTELTNYTVRSGRLARIAPTREIAQAENCRMGMALVSKLQDGFAKMATERDIAYNNFLRNIQRAVDPEGRLTHGCAPFLR